MVSSRGCPGSAELAAFADGGLEEAELERIGEHVANCAACEAALAEHEPSELALALQTLGLHESRTNGSGLEVDEKLREAAVRSFSDGELVVDVGRRLARALESGPQRIGRFELLSQLGVGSFGHVFKARDSELDREVALKVQRSGQLGSAAEDARFLREARSAAQLDHPQIVRLYDSGQTEDGVCYLVTELVEGTTLAETIARRELDHESAARLIAEIAMALQYAHAHGIVHRDIKPSNILIDAAGRPHIADFGLAKRDVGDATMTPDGEVLGTPAYMSPELARGDANAVDARCDVYSLGVVLYELLSGERPFAGNRRMLMTQVLEEEPRPPRVLDDRIPRDLETVCLRAMAKSPARRYASAQDFADDLLRFARGEAIHARPIGVRERAWRWCKRNPVAIAIFAAVVAISAFGFWHLTGLSRTLVQRSALESAEQYAELLEVVNDFYSAEVVDRIGSHGVEATADYAVREGTIPLPATLLTKLLERVGDTETGMRGRHYSAYPFKFRKDGGPRDRFERVALDELEKAPKRPYYEFVDDFEGAPALRFARARIMAPSCLGCHNNSEDSTKRDWKVGDVVGVIEVIRPLEGDTKRTREGLRSTFATLGFVALILLGLTTIAVLARRRA